MFDLTYRRSGFHATFSKVIFVIMVALSREVATQSTNCPGNAWVEVKLMHKLREYTSVVEREV